MADSNDFLDQALAQVTKQAAASNPYIQFGGMLGQQQLPVSREDPWGSIAASGLQNLISGMATGYGQGQVQQDLSQLIPVMPQLYENPSAVQNPGIDPNIFNPVQLGAIQNQQAQQRELAKFFQQETIKSQLNPQAPLYGSQKRLADLDLLRGLNEFQLQQKAMQEATGAQPNNTAAAGQVAAPVAAPTQENAGQMSVPSGVQQDPVPPIQAFRRKYLALGMPFQKANDEASQEYGKALDANRERVTEAGKAKLQSEEQQRQEQAKEKIEMTKWLEESSNKIASLETPLQQMGGILEKLPDFGAPLGIGSVKRTAYDIAARASGAPGEGSREALAARATLDAITPKFAGEIIDQALPGPLTEKELLFVRAGLPGDNKTLVENQAIYNTMKVARDLLRFENAFKQAYAKQGMSKSQIISKWEEKRSKLGGSFIVGNSLHPEVYPATEQLLKLGGSL